MLKKLLIAVAIMLPTIVSAQTVKLGLVNTQSILTSMPESKEAEEKLAAISKKYEDEYAKLGEEMKRKLDEFQALKEDEPQAIKDRKMQDLQEYQGKIQQFEQMAQQDIQKQQEALMTPIISKVRGAIESVGKEGNYTTIQEIGAVLYFGSPAEDITPQVKAKLGLK